MIKRQSSCFHGVEDLKNKYDISNHAYNYVLTTGLSVLKRCVCYNWSV